MRIQLRWRNRLAVFLVVLLPTFANGQSGASLAAGSAAGTTLSNSGRVHMSLPRNATASTPATAMSSLTLPLSETPTLPATSSTTASLLTSPLSFEPNVGQAGAGGTQVSFLAHGAGYTLFLSPMSATLAVRESGTPAAIWRPGLAGLGHRTTAAAVTQTVSVSESVIRLRYVNANPRPQVVGLDPLPGRVNYFIGHDPSQWHTGIPTYARVAYRNVYPGTDLTYYGHQGTLEYDWQIQPGADPRAIALAVDGADNVHLDAQDNLILHTSLGALVQHAPIAYQNVNGQRHDIATRYTLNGAGQIAFALGRYDPHQPLTIDPVLSYATYLGGGSSDSGNGIAVDSAGHAYITGQTQSTDFITTTGTFSTTSAAGINVFVTKLSATGHGPFYSTYFGGSGADYGFAIAVDSAGHAYVAGATSSSDFPMYNALQSSCGDAATGCPNGDAFVTELNATGSGLLYSTYLGGDNGDGAHGIAVDSNDNAYIAGYTNSSNFPTHNAAQSSCGDVDCVNSDAFVAKLSAGGSALLYSTYLGGSGIGGDDAYGIAVDNAGNAYVTGDTYSADFPTHNALQSTCHDATGCSNGTAFVTKLTAAGAFDYSTYLGGSGGDFAIAITVDRVGNAYVTGGTYSADFPMHNALQSSCGDAGCSQGDAFVTVLNASGSALDYSSYLGGSGSDFGYGIAVASAGNAYVAGQTYSADFPVRNALQSSCGDAGCSQGDAFVTELNVSSSGLFYSTYLGGNGDDYANAIAINRTGNAYVTGQTYSTNFPTVNALQRTCGDAGCSQGDAFVAKVSALTSLPPIGGTIPWHPHTILRFSDHLSLNVDLADGHADLTAAGLRVSARGADLAYDTTWDSTLAQTGISTTAGQGWVSSLTPHISGALTQTVVYTDDAGAVWSFPFTGALNATAPYTSYSVPSGQPWQLTTSTAGYTLTDFLNGETWTFDNQGRYLAATDSYGNGNTLAYGLGGPTSWTNSGGRALAISAANGLLTNVQSPTWVASGGQSGQHVTCVYNGSRQLTGLTWGAGTADALTATFGYSGTQLVTVTTPAGHVWTIGYDAQGRVVAVTSPTFGVLGQAGYMPSYTTQFSYPTGQAQVVEGANTATPRQTTYGLSSQGETIAITNALGYTTTLSYDVDHDVTSATDANDHTTAYHYHYIGPVGPSGLGSTGLVTETDQPAIDGSGPITTGYTYDGNNDLVKTVSGNGGLTYYQYDGHHSIITTTQLLGGTVWRGMINVISPTTGLLLGQVDGRGVTVPAPAQGLTPTATLNVNDAQYERTWGYNAAGDLTSASTPPITTTAGANQPATTTYAPDADGNVTAMTTPNGATTSYAYDHLGRLVQTTQPSVTLYDDTQQMPVTSIGYDGDGDVITSTDGAGDLTQFSYDPLGRLVGTINPVGATTLYTYTATTLSAVQDPAGHVTTYGYDAAGERTSATDPLGTTTQQYGYDGVGNTIAITTPLDYAQPSALSVETRQYDALDEPISATLAGVGESIPTPAQTTLWSYDHDGNVTGQILPTGDQTQNTFDSVDRRTQVSLLTRPPAVQTLTLDPADNLIQQGDFNQRTHMLSVDGDNRVQQQVDTCPTCAPYNAPITTTSTYDPNGNVVSPVQQSGSQSAASSATYNALDQLTSQDDGWGPTAYGYDAAGRLRTETLPGNTEVITHTLDASGRATSVSDTLADPVAGLSTSTSSFTYTPNDLPLTDTLPDGVTEGRTYDADNRLTQIQFTAPGQRAWTYGYAYSPQGRTVTITNGNPNLVNPVWPLSYDALGRLASINTGTQAAWHYDATGNITGTNSVLGGTVTYPQATYAYTYAAIAVLTPANWLPNELVVVTSTQSAGASPAVTTYGYDNSGDTTAITASNGLSYILNYDALGRLAGVARLDPNNATCCSVLLAYDALGRRASYTAVAAGPSAPPPPFQEVFQYRGTQVSQVSQVIVTGTNTTPFTETFVDRPDGSPLELLYQQQDGQGHNRATVRYGYVLDGQGSVVALTDSTGTVVNSYAYDAWGQALVASEGIPQPLRYRGYWWDGWDNMLSGTKDQGWNGGALPWYALGPREYDPILGRFLQPDPSSQDGVRSYVYCHDDPVDCADPSGLEGEPDQSAGTDDAGVTGAIGAATGQAPAPPAGVQGAAMPTDILTNPGVGPGLDAAGTDESAIAPVASFDEDAAAAAAQAARANLGYRPPRKVVAAIQSGLRTISGWKASFPGEGMAQSASRQELGFEDPVESKILENATIRGYQFATDEEADQGSPGRAAASHAEPQLDYLAPGEPLATSWQMCDSCVDYFRFQAIDSGVPRVVAEPKSILVFYPDGSITVRGPLGRYVFHLNGTIDRP